MATIFAASDYTDWYTQLNKIRQKHYQTNIPVSTVSKNTPGLSSQMTTLQNSINTVKNGEYHLRRASINTTFSGTSVGERILLSTKTSINTILTNMYNICHYDGSNYSGDDDHDGYDASHVSGCDGHQSYCGGYVSGCDANYYECRDDPIRELSYT